MAPGDRRRLASRTGAAPTDQLPQVAGYVSLALALAAYEAWMQQPGRETTELVAEAMVSLHGYLQR